MNERPGTRGGWLVEALRVPALKKAVCELSGGDEEAAAMVHCAVRLHCGRGLCRWSSRSWCVVCWRICCRPGRLGAARHPGDAARAAAPRGRAGALAELVAATGAPAISAYVLDSDVADMEALTPGGQRWRTYLHPDVAERFGAPPLEQSPGEVLQAALEWSGQAGLTADADAVRQALAAHHVEAEDTVDELVAALGVPTG